MKFCDFEIESGASREYPCIYIVRHGETEWNGTTKRIRGWENISLNGNGIKQAEVVADVFAEIDISEIYSSDLKRCMATAEIIHGKGNLNIQYTRCLRPWDLGVYTGKFVSDIIDGLEYHYKNPEQAVFQGESFNEFGRRLLACLEGIINEFLVNKKNIIIVTHYRVIEAIKFLLKNESLDNNTGGVYSITTREEL